MPSPTTNKTGYVDGSDLLMKLGTGAIGHCSTHSVTYSTETADVAVKPAASVAATTAGLYKEKRIKGLNIQAKASGVKFYSETESGFKAILGKWALGQTVTCSFLEREYDSTPYLSGSFVIAELTETNPAKDDATYDVTLDLSGAPTVLDESKLDLLAGASSSAQL